MIKSSAQESNNETTENGESVQIDTKVDEDLFKQENDEEEEPDFE